MEIITEEKFAELVKKADESGVVNYASMQEQERLEVLTQIEKSMDNPVDIQKRLAAKLSLVIEEQIDEEMRTSGRISGATNRQTKDLFEMLDKIQHNVHGKKSVNLNLEADSVSHGQIASKLKRLKNGSNS